MIKSMDYVYILCRPDGMSLPKQINTQQKKNSSHNNCTEAAPYDIKAAVEQNHATEKT